MDLTSIKCCAFLFQEFLFHKVHFFNARKLVGNTSIPIKIPIRFCPSLLHNRRHYKRSAVSADYFCPRLSDKFLFIKFSFSACFLVESLKCRAFTTDKPYWGPPDSFSCWHEKLCGGIEWIPFRYVPLHLRDRCGVASLRDRNCSEITVLMCKQKPYPVRL